MKKSHKITIISSISAIALVAAAVISYPYIFNESPIQSTDSTSSVVSSAPSSPSSETTSNEVASNEVASNEVSSTIVVPEIEAPVSSETPAVSSAPTEIKVEGSPTSKPSSTSSVLSKPKDTTPKPTTQVSSMPPAKPTGNGDVYDPLTGTYPKVGDISIHPITGKAIVWIEQTSSGKPGWMATEASGKGGDSAGLDKDFMQDLYDQGYTGNDIGSDD